MEGYRARRDGKEISVASLQDLFGMVSRGELRRTDEVWTPSGWVKAADLPELRASRGADPWDAWSDSDLEDADAVYQGYVKAAPPPAAPVFGSAPSRAPTGPVQQSPPPSPGPAPAGATPLVAPPLPRAPAALDPVSVPVDPASLPEPPRRSMPPGVLSMERGAPGARTSRPSFPPDADEATDPGRSPGQVIPLPRPARRPPPEVAVIRERPSRPVPLVRASWLLMWVGVGLLALALWFLWINVGGTYRPTDPPVAGVEGPATPDAPEATEATEASDAPTLAQTERELRAGLTTEVRPIDAEGELGDALLIDLQNLRTDVVAVDAPVTVWSGRQRDVPKTAEVHVRLSSDRDLPRQFGAIALVVGRYKRSLRLDIPVLEVIVPGPNGPLSTTLDPKAAEEFYIARITLEALLTAK